MTVSCVLTSIPQCVCRSWVRAIHLVLGVLLISGVATESGRAQISSVVERLDSELLISMDEAVLTDNSANASRLALTIASDIIDTPLSDVGDELEVAEILIDLAQTLSQLDAPSTAITLLDQAKGVLLNARAAANDSAAAVIDTMLQTVYAAQRDIHASVENWDAAIAVQSQLIDAKTELIGPSNPILLEEVERLQRFYLDSGKTWPDDRKKQLRNIKQAKAQSKSVASIKDKSKADAYDLSVFYGSVSYDTGSEDPSKAFLRERSGLTLGYVSVSVPKSRVVGSIPRPSALTPWVGEDRKLHVILSGIQRSPSLDAFSDRFGKELKKSPDGKKEAFIYVHGHGVTFEGAARRAAQLAVDLDIRNGAVLYNWPTGGKLTGYGRSGANAAVAADGLAELLTLVRGQADQVHIIAHSMGNRVLLGALEQLELTAADTANSTPFTNIIWASADLDAELFANKVSDIRHVADNMVLYAAEDDRALAASRKIAGGYKRAGQAPPSTNLSTAIDVIDTTGAHSAFSDVINHSDYVTGAINDLKGVIWFRFQPNERCTLEKIDLPETEHRALYWSMEKSPSSCSSEHFNRAINVRRRYKSSANDHIEKTIDSLLLSERAQLVESWKETQRVYGLLFQK